MRNVVRLAELLSSYAQKGAALGIDHGRMCETCAFRRGSVTQLEPHNIDAAASSLAYEGIFNCHINDYQDAGKQCAGFLYAKEYEKSRI